jgi:hypothetical protein
VWRGLTSKARFSGGLFRYGICNRARRFQRSPVVPPNLAGALAWRPSRERDDGAALLTLWHDGQWSQVTQAALLRVRYGFIEA